VASPQTPFDGFVKATWVKFKEVLLMEKILTFIERITKEFDYKPLPKDKSALARAYYTKAIPEGLHLEGHPTQQLFSQNGTLICKGYTRIVVGDYGAFIEFSREQALKENFKCFKGQEYRYKDPSFASRVKYFWYTCKDVSSCKIYFQQKTVSYADYKPKMLYISPYEVEYI
jgi:hypothetical protein